MDVLERLRQLLKERNWSEYRLARLSGLNESTIANIYRRNTLPTIPTLEAICSAFGITLAQFFAQDQLVEVTPQVRQLLDAWSALTPNQKELLIQLARSYQEE